MATIIKAGQLTHGAHAAQPLAFNMNDVTANAETYLEEVRRQAAQIVVRARQEAEQVKRRAEADGLQSAVTAAEKTLRATFDPKLASLQKALLEGAVQLRDARQNWLAQWEQNVVELAVAIAGRLVRHELERASDISHAWVREALELAAGCQRIELRLNPRDFETLGQDSATLAKTVATVAPTQIVADATVSPGGCRVLTEHGLIENTLEAQLARLSEELAH